MSSTSGQPVPGPLDEARAVEYVLGLCSDHERAETERIAAASSSAAEMIDRLRMTVRSLADLRVEQAAMAVSPEQSRALRSLMAGFAPSLGERAGDAVREILALLVFDSWRSPAGAGFRGGVSGRMTRFEADSIELDVEVSAGATESTWHLTGQINGHPGPVKVTVVREGGGIVADADADESGYFDLQLTEGRYLLRFLTRAVVVFAGPIWVGAAERERGGGA